MMRALKKILFCVIAFVIGIGAVGAAAPDTVYAAERERKFDTTDVMDDLTSSTVGGQAFELKDYPFDESKRAQIICFVEYCYSFRANMRGNYGLYVYVYNPQGLNLSEQSKRNKIQMAVKYDTDGNPSDYEKFDLQFLSKSERPDYMNLFYKFKVSDKAIAGKTFADRVNSNARRYDVSGIELLTYGAENATDYPVNGTYTFTGYSAGYGPEPDAESTLSCEVGYLETVTLDVKHTYYRTETSAKGAGYQNQLDTVYFAVPQRFFDTYGKLQRIKAEWYEYKTTDIVVTSNQAFYDKAYPYLGVVLPEYTYDKELYYSLGQDAGDGGGGIQVAKWGWNLGNGYLHIDARMLCYLFKVGRIDDYEPYGDVVNAGGVESNALYEYIKNYDKSFRKGTLPIKDGTISADLFADDIDEYRKLDTEFGKIRQGYSYYDFDADLDLHKLASWQEGNPSFWENWANWGLLETLFGKIPEEESREVSPIYMLKAEDMTGTDEEIAERLLINAKDVQALKDFRLQASENESAVVLFRFAASDYYSAAIDIIELGKGFLGQDKKTGGQAYRAWESVFLDFDVIQLTFNADGEYKVIPAVSSPIDIVNAVSPPVQTPDGIPWWKIALGAVLLALLLVLLFPLVVLIVRGVIALVCLPFKAVSKLWKSGEQRRKERKYKRARDRMDKQFEKFHRQAEKENEKTVREAKKVNVTELKAKLWTGKKKESELSKAERYALNHDEEWLREQEIVNQILYGDTEDYSDW